MTVYSKLLPYTCYELGHTWHPSCTKSAFDVFISAGYTSLQIYAAVYLLIFLGSKKKFSRENIKKLLKKYVQSSLFLTYNGTFFVTSFCVLRLILQRITFLSPGWLPGFFSSILAIYVERTSRRSQLATYVCNVATECFWNVLKARGYVTPIPGGEAILFSVSMMLFGYYYKTTTNFSSLVNSLLKFLLGKDESGEEKVKAVEASTRTSLTAPSCSKKDPGPSHTTPSHYEVESRLSHIYKWRHSKCPHSGGCITYALKAAASTGMKGYAFIVCFKLYTSIRKLTRRPSLILEILSRGSTIKCGIAFAWFSSVFKLTCCLARRWSNDDKPVHGVLAGALAGLAMGIYPSSTLTIYATWKALETLYKSGIEVGCLPAIPHGTELLYAFATAYLFHVAMLENFNMKPSYWRFLMDLSGGKIAEFNKSLLDCYGLDSGRLQVWPSYNKKYLTKEFIEKFYK